MTISKSFSRMDFAQIFKRDDIRGLYPSQLDCPVMELIGQQLAEMVVVGGRNAVIIGYDARNGSFELAQALRQGLARGGAEVVSLGLCSSEQIYYMTGRYQERFAAGAMVTASHNPAEYNGVKFIHSGAQPFTRDELTALRVRLEKAWQPPCAEDIGEEYADYMFQLSGFADARPLQGPPMNIVVAAGNGVGAVTFRPFSERLRALGVVCDFLDAEPDGHFPNGIPNPLLHAYNARLGNAVRRAGANMGIGFDGDADRAGFVDERGKAVIPSHVLALVAADKLEKLARRPSGGVPVVMGNICCSHLLKDLFADPTYAEFVDTPVGHGQIKQLMRHESYCDRVIFAGEHSGHYFYPEFFSVDSGVLTSLTMIRLLMRLRENGGTLSQTLAGWRQRYLWSGEINYKMPDDTQTRRALECLRHEADRNGQCRRFAVVPHPHSGLPEVKDVTGQDGETLMPDVKLQSDHGSSGWWLVMRPSGNEPMLRVNAEVWGKDSASLAAICGRVAELLQNFGGLKT